MKRAFFILLLMINSAWAATTPFRQGVNLTGWFQTSNVRQIQFTKFTKQDLINIKSLGCDVIRLPINLHSMTTGDPNYTIDPLLYYFLDQVVDWAEELQLHLILDNHSFDPAKNTDPNIVNILLPVWKQMAEHYKNRSNLIYYEILNEPHGISDNDWNLIQYKVIGAIRGVDQVHTIIVGPAGWNGYNNLDEMSLYRDNNLIYTFHFYDPFLFTHQGASWTDPSMEPLAGMPFPYAPDKMPEFPPELQNTWIEGNYNNYSSQGTVSNVYNLIKIAADFKKQRNVPVFCGEFGVYIPNSDNTDRIFWYSNVRKFLEGHEISWTIWDYKGGFGLFEKGSTEMFDYDLNVPLLEALGFTAPPQKEFIVEPETAGFNLYMDYVGSNILESSWTNAGLLDYYSKDNPAIGDFCIHWTGVNQYGNISLRFSPIKDLSILAIEGFAVVFYVRCNARDVKFDIRFVDTKTDDPTDHPWRMRYIIDGNRVFRDDSWKHLQIPLSSFTEHGSWDNGWYNPVGDFDFSAVERFEIVSEHGDLKGKDLYFDNIRIVKF